MGARPTSSVKSRLQIILVMLTLLALMLSSCERKKASGQQKLCLSRVPSTDPGKFVRDSQSFLNYLEREIGASIELTVPMNYATVVEAIAT